MIRILVIMYNLILYHVLIIEFSVFEKKVYRGAAVKQVLLTSI